PCRSTIVKADIHAKTLPIGQFNLLARKGPNS
ncbi:unnamed protein product, partial [marine sediment metagenome]